VVVRRLALDRYLHHDCTGFIYFQNTRFIAGFSQQIIAVRQGLRGIDFILRAFPFKNAL
jgi:hypothetical protein